jgi:uncharacterized membrane protein YhaH (DUF805 family)
LTVASEWPLYKWLFFGFAGRITRAPYFLAFILLSVVQAYPLYRTMLLVPETPAANAWSVIFLGVLIASLVSFFALTVKRLHDLGRAGIESLAIIIPIVSIVAFVYLCMAPGSDAPNAHGRIRNAPPDAA